MRNTTRLAAATGLLAPAVVAILSGGGAAFAQMPPAHPHAVHRRHVWHGGSGLSAPAYVVRPQVAPVGPALGPIEQMAPPPRPYGGCIPTAPAHDAYGASIPGC